MLQSRDFTIPDHQRSTGVATTKYGNSQVSIGVLVRPEINYQKIARALIALAQGELRRDRFLEQLRTKYPEAQEGQLYGELAFFRGDKPFLLIDRTQPGLSATGHVI